MQVRRIVLVRMCTAMACRAPRTSRRRIRACRTRAKGSIRKEQEDLVLDAQKKGQIDGLVVRLPDFYGPGAENSLANPIFRAALAGKTANWLGPVNPPHEFVYMPDTGPVIADLAELRGLLRRGLELRRPGRYQQPGLHYASLSRRRTRAEVSHRGVGTS